MVRDYWHGGPTELHRRAHIYRSAGGPNRDATGCHIPPGGDDPQIQIGEARDTTARTVKAIERQDAS
jgi:hypothetical protein